MTKQEFVEEMVQLDTDIHQSIEVLNSLRVERDTLLKLAKSHNVELLAELPTDLQEKLLTNIDRLKKVVGLTDGLRRRSADLKSQMHEEIELAESNKG